MKSYRKRRKGEKKGRTTYRKRRQVGKSGNVRQAGRKEGGAGKNPLPTAPTIAPTRATIATFPCDMFAYNIDNIEGGCLKGSREGRQRSRVRSQEPQAMDE
jgi:hypothetical protein